MNGPADPAGIFRKCTTEFKEIYLLAKGYHLAPVSKTTVKYLADRLAERGQGNADDKRR